MSHPTEKPISTGKKIIRVLINMVVRILTGILCKVKGQEQLARVPSKGPLIVVVNHVNFLELPILYPRVRTDWAIGFSKKENWENPLYRILFDTWNVIPINRDEVDLTAMRRGLEALDDGCILFVTPEGTRSHHGRLQQGKPGVVMLALRSGAPVLPIVCYGGEKFGENIRRLKRTDYHIAVGEPFYVTDGGKKVIRSVRQQITNEIMCQLAALMPTEYHGVYGGSECAGTAYLRFDVKLPTNPPQSIGALHSDVSPHNTHRA